MKIVTFCRYSYQRKMKRRRIETCCIFCLNVFQAVKRKASYEVEIDLLFDLLPDNLKRIRKKTTSMITTTKHQLINLHNSSNNKIIYIYITFGFLLLVTEDTGLHYKII